MNAVALLACAFALAACGHDDDSRGARSMPPAVEDQASGRPGRLDVLVRDPHDRPVAGARVTEVDYDSRRIREDPVPVGPVPGTYRLDRHVPGKIYLHVVAPGLAPSVESTEIGEGEAREITVRLAPGVSIRGVVLDDRGLPVEGATVESWPEHGEFPDTSEEQPILTGPGGTFEVPGLAATRHQLSASTESADMPTAEPFYVDAPADGVVLRIARYGQVRFRLRVPPGGPVPDTVASELCVFNWLGGEFTLDRLPPGRRSFRLFSPGYSALTLSYVVTPGETTDLGEFLLDEGVVLRGRVVDTSGKAVEGADVTLVLHVIGGSPHVSTDGSGRFELPHGERGANQLSVARHGFVCGKFAVTGESATAASAFVLLHGGVLRARVVDAEGRPVQSLHLYVTDLGGDIVYGDPVDNATDVHGNCEVRLPAGTYRVRAGTSASTEFVLAEDGTTDITLKLR